MKMLDQVLTEQKRTRVQSVAELAAGAIAPASIDSRATARSARDPANQYDPAHPDRDSRVLHGTIAPATVTPEQQAILDVLPAKQARRFRKQFGLPE